MTRKIETIGLLLLLSVGQIVYGQTTFNYKDDYKKVLAKTKDQNNNLSYDKLLKRFSANDTTLTDFEVLGLLIGFTDKPEFKPYTDLNKEREIYKLNGEDKFQAALDSANIFLKKHPLSQQAIIEISYSYYKLNNKDSSDFYMYQFRRIMKAMDFSGDGKEIPIFALGPADGQNYIRKYLSAKVGSMGSGSDKNGNFLDILEAKYKDGTSESLYFIIQHATDKMFSEDDLKLFDEKDKKKKKNK
ncbi:MAG: DUF4919 domain-containing protein [Bacteroidota bacterium]|nr:DUF4919 domain-containing protein [Bacteroidota bacterium]